MLQLVRHVHLWMADIAMQEGLRELTAQVAVDCLWHEALLSLDMHCYDKVLLSCTVAMCLACLRLELQHASRSR